MLFYGGNKGKDVEHKLWLPDLCAGDGDALEVAVSKGQTMYVSYGLNPSLSLIHLSVDSMIPAGWTYAVVSHSTLNAHSLLIRRV